MAPPVDNATLLAKLEELVLKADATNQKADQTNRKIEEMQQSINQMSEEQDAVKVWKPELENKVAQLQNSASTLKMKMDLFIQESPKVGDHALKVSEDGEPSSAHLEDPAAAEAPGPNGRRDELGHRGRGAGVVTTLVPSPITGANKFSNLTPVPFQGYDNSDTVKANSSSSYNSALPQLEFPKFDGASPKLWIRRCESYFDVYDIPVHQWVKLATMNFTASAAFWMQSIEMDVRKCTWKDLTKFVIDRFERDEHSHLVQQFLHIKQSGSVAEYVEMFDVLVHHLLARDPYVNPVWLTSKFVEGLKHEIKAVVLVHKPKDLDSASSLALLQEEVLLGFPSSQWGKIEEVVPSKPSEPYLLNQLQKLNIIPTLVEFLLPWVLKEGNLLATQEPSLLMRGCQP
ncbi:unnamed protein product [Urochloa humidicola]